MLSGARICEEKGILGSTFKHLKKTQPNVIESVIQNVSLLGKQLTVA